MKKNIPKKLIKKLKKFLGPDGIKFFKNCLKGSGRLDPVFDSGGIPHPVHFREGMQIRNFMRSTNLCEDWSDNDYDDNWADAVQTVIDLND